MAEMRTVRSFVYNGFGFPVVFLNAPMINVRGVWTPRVDYNKIARMVLQALAHKPARLTGHEIRFIRQSFEMTLSAFGARFGVSHPAVLKWEGAKDSSPALKWPIEKDIRLFILDTQNAQPRAFKELYEELRREATARQMPVRVDVAA